MTTLQAQIRDAGRKLEIADAVMYAAIDAQDHDAFVEAIEARKPVNNYHNALLVAQIEQRKAAR